MITEVSSPVCSKAYVLMDVAEGKCEQVTQTLANNPGVTMVDRLEEPPQVIMVVQAAEQRKLAELTVDAVSRVENMALDIQFLPAYDSIISHAI